MSPDGRSLPVALLVEARPRQWLKNVFVLAAPAAAGVLTEGDEFVATILTFVAFCLVSSGTYYINDLADLDQDRAHPTKSARPLAAGEIPPAAAQAVGVLAMACGVAIALLVSVEVAGVVAGYVVLTTLYTYVLKHLAVVDLVTVAAGFMLRAIGGAAAADVPISDWFFIVASAGSVYLITGKRLAEFVNHHEPGPESSSTRAAIDQYSESYLRHVLSAAAGIAILAYCLWAFDEASLAPKSAVWLELSIVPFVLAILRYGLLIDSGGGEEPDDLLLSDPTLLIAGAVWVLILGTHLYVG